MSPSDREKIVLTASRVDENDGVFVGDNDRRKNSGAFITVADLYHIINDAVSTSVKEAMDLHSVQCPIPIEAKCEVSHIFGVVKDIGGGSIERGAEELRKNAGFVTGLRKRVHSAADKVMMIIIGVVSVGMLTALWYGIKHHLHIPDIGE